MPLIVGHGLLGASVVAAAREPGAVRIDARYWLLGAVLSVLPDLDLFFPWILGLGVDWHGAFMHSILFAFAGGATTAWLTRSLRLRETLIYSAAILSHGLLDVAVKKSYGGAALLWPFSSRVYRLGVIDYFAFYPGSRLEPLPQLIWRAIEISLYELLLFGPVFVAALLLRQIRQMPEEQTTDGQQAERI